MPKLSFPEIESFITNGKADWKKRTASLETLIQMLSKNDLAALKFTIKNFQALALQINDLRSAIVKLASKLIETLVKAAEELNHNLDKFSEHYIKDANFVKAMGSANKVINIHATTAFSALFDHDCVNFSTVEQLFNTHKKNKNGLTREKVGMAVAFFISNCVQFGKRKVRYDELTFLRKAIDFLLKDASASVRNWAKEASMDFSKLEDAINGGEYGGGREDRSVGRKSPSRSREKKPKRRKTKKGTKTKLDKGKAKTTPIKGFNEDNGHDNEEKGFSTTKNPYGKKKYGKEKEIDIFHIIENPKMKVKDKIDQLRNIGIGNFGKTCSFDEFVKLLSLYQYLKNYEMKKFVVGLIEKTTITRFFENLLAYSEKEKIHKKANYRFFIERLLEEELSDFIEFFIRKPGSFSITLLNKKFDQEEFESLYNEQQQLTETIFFIINKNIMEDGGDSFLKENITLLESLIENDDVLEEAKNYEFGDEVYYLLDEVNPRLFELLCPDKDKFEREDSEEEIDSEEEERERAIQREREENEKARARLEQQQKEKEEKDRKKKQKAKEEKERKKKQKLKEEKERKRRQREEEEQRQREEEEEEERLREEEEERFIEEERQRKREEERLRKLKEARKKKSPIKKSRKTKEVITTYEKHEKYEKYEYHEKSGSRSQEDNQDGSSTQSSQSKAKLSKIESLMKKANNETKKTVIKSILKHIDNIDESRDSASMDGIFNKTFEILRCTIDSEQLDDELISLSCRLTKEIFSLSDNDPVKIGKLNQLLVRFLHSHSEFGETLGDYIVSRDMRKPFLLYLIRLVQGNDIGSTIQSLKVLTVLLKAGKESYGYKGFHNEFVSLFDGVEETMQDLFSHSEVGVRKNLVQFVVQCKFFLESVEYKRLVSGFSFEQKKLVEIYVKKRAGKR